MKYRDIPLLIAALAVGWLGAAIEHRFIKPTLMMTRVVIDDTYEEYEAERDSWWNPRWGQSPTGDLWIIGNHTYTTRDLMGRGA